MRYLARYGWTVFWLCCAGLCAVGLCLLAASNLSAKAPPMPIAPAAPAVLPLSDRVIAVDAGHGGYDGGAVGRKSGVQEKELNLDVALKLRDALMAQGASVVVTRDGDYALCDEDPPMRKKLQDMQRRAGLIDDGGAEMVLSIHMNEYASGSQSGPQVFYRKGCAAGAELAQVLQQRMNLLLDPPRKRAVNTGDYYILTLGIPSVLVECGFLSNATEERLLSDAAYRQRIADSVADGVLAYFALPERAAPLPRQQR